MLETIIEKIKEYRLQSIMIGTGIVIGGSLLLFGQSQSGQTTLEQTELSSLGQTSISEVEEQTISSTGQVVVDVKGAVNHPGVYTLQDGERVYDAVEKAGGFTDQADEKSVNLAQKVSDESVIYVATVDEEISVVATTDEAANTTTDSKAISLNTATVEELQTISGIGAKRAADIVAYREENGNFKTVDELSNISGIGEKTLEKLRPYVTVD